MIPHLCQKKISVGVSKSLTIIYRYDHACLDEVHWEESKVEKNENGDIRNIELVQNLRGLLK